VEITASIWKVLWRWRHTFLQNVKNFSNLRSHHGENIIKSCIVNSNCIISFRFPWQALTYPSWNSNMFVKPPVSVIGLLLKRFLLLQLICNLTHQATSGWLIGFDYMFWTPTDMAGLRCSTEAVLLSIFLSNLHEFRWNKNPKTLTCPCVRVGFQYDNGNPTKSQ
jgi:hypothetical protein